MATTEFIQKRLDGKLKELDKLNSKLKRIEKAEASNWENNPYYYDESDKKYCLKEIDRVTVAIEELKAQLQSSIEKDNSRDIKVIIDFLEEWKKRVYEYYKSGIDEANAMYNKVVYARDEYNRCRYGTEEYYKAKDIYDTYSEDYRCKLYGYYRDYTDEEQAYAKKWGRMCIGRVKVKDGELEYCKDYTGKGGLDKLKKDLDKEATVKYDDIIERTNRVVGQITDATGLYIGHKGDLNGFIIGTNGKAKVETIGAGGYNIQCYHFRTLIHKVK